MPWPCFWVEEIGEDEAALRRFTLHEAEGLPPCADGSMFHNAQASIERQPRVRVDDEHGGHVESIPAERFEGDPRWPTHCGACPYEFRPEDYWQVWTEPIYRRPETGEEWAQRALPVGAMFDSWWAPAHWRNEADGLALTVVLPPPGDDARVRFWNIDGPANSNGQLTPHAWTRTGDPHAMPPTVSATPSILTSDYHSFLTDGVLGDG